MDDFGPPAVLSKKYVFMEFVFNFVSQGSFVFPIFISFIFKKFIIVHPFLIDCIYKILIHIRYRICY